MKNSSGNTAYAILIGILLLGGLFSPLAGHAQLLRDGSFEQLGNIAEPGEGWTFCMGAPDPQVLDGSGPGIFGIHTAPADGQRYAGFFANDQGLAEELGQPMLLEAGMHYYGSIDLFRSIAHQNWNGKGKLEIWGGENCDEPEELLWSSGTVTHLDEWRQYPITFAPIRNHHWMSIRCELVPGSGEMTYLCVDDLRLDNVYFSVDFLGFEAVPADHQVHLTWETAALQDATQFDIEWGNDGVQFAKVGEIKGSGSESFFSFVHESHLSGLQFYRIRTIDQGGHENLSEIRQVIVGEEAAWTVFPNPSSGQLSVLGTTAIDLISLTDLSGKTLAIWHGQAESRLTFELPNHLQNGIYILNVRSKGITSNHSILVGK